MKRKLIVSLADVALKFTSMHSISAKDFFGYSFSSVDKLGVFTIKTPKDNQNKHINLEVRWNYHKEGSEVKKEGSFGKLLVQVFKYDYVNKKYGYVEQDDIKVVRGVKYNTYNFRNVNIPKVDTYKLKFKTGSNISIFNGYGKVFN